MAQRSGLDCGWAGTRRDSGSGLAYSKPYCLCYAHGRHAIRVRVRVRVMGRGRGSGVKSVRVAVHTADI